MADTSVPGNIQIHLGKITKVLLLSANKTKRWQKCHYDNKQLTTYNLDLILSNLPFLLKNLKLIIEKFGSIKSTS